MEETMMMMMMKMKKIQQPSTSTTRQSTVGSPILSSVHQDSKTISKTIPKIRIIHVFAPEIIKTDASNFRELVQRLTGKPAADQKGPKIKIKTPKIPTRGNHAAGGSLETMIKEEEAMWKPENSAGFLADYDGEFSLLPAPLETNHFYMHDTLHGYDILINQNNYGF